MNPRAGFFEVLRSSPKTPTVMAVYTAGISSFMLNHFFVISSLINNENLPCQSCYLAKSVGFNMATGVIIPILSLPHLVYYMVGVF